MLEEIDLLMSAYRGEMPGAALLVIRNGEVVVCRAYGFADLEARVATTPATNYRLASITKQFTAAAIVLLVQHGRLSLDDPIRSWLPSLPVAAAPVTIRHLLTHVSGLIDYEDLIAPDLVRQLHDADVLQLLAAQDHTYFAPGSQYRYSDTGYALLALIVGAAAGEDFASFLRRHIFLPLGMRTTIAYEQGVSVVANRAVGYTARGSAWARTDQSLTSAVLGDGGIYSSLEDLARWDAALYGSPVLDRASLRQLFAPAVATDDPNVRYGFGWRLTGESVWHSGETVGFRTVIVRFPRRRLTVILLSNRSEQEPYSSALAIAKLFFPDADLTRAATVVVGPDCAAHPLPEQPS